MTVRFAFSLYSSFSDGVGVYRMPIVPSSPRVTPNHRRQTGAAAIKRAAKKSRDKSKAKQRGAA